MWDFANLESICVAPNHTPRSILSRVTAMSQEVIEICGKKFMKKLVTEF